MEEIVHYILKFLLRSSVSDAEIRQIGYTSDPADFHRYKLVIYPSFFFKHDVYGSVRSIPDAVHLDLWENTPLIYGEPVIDKKNDTVILYADIIASTYFLITRYEETIHRNIRDQYGRFPGRESLPYKARFIDRPIVDEYGENLRKLLKNTGFDVKEPIPTNNNIYLTHDVDTLTRYRSIRNFLGGIKQVICHKAKLNTVVCSFFGNINNDPWFTFPFLFEKNNSLKDFGNTKTIAFIKSGGGANPADHPLQNINNKDFRHLFELCHKYNVETGLHPSYEAAGKPGLLVKEKEKLEKVLANKIILSRNHFLASKEPEDMEKLIEAGITNDFTMGYADICGFRLGTSHPVRWINPATQKLTTLTLHPLMAMDVTLSNEIYMNLNEAQALTYVKSLTEQAKKHGGDICLLWHNSSVDGSSYHRNLYSDIINYLKAL